MTALAFRRAGAGDAECLAVLHALCFDEPWDTASFARLLARPGALGLLACSGTDGARSSGFVLFEQVADEAEILTLGVDPAFHGRGIGTALLAHGLGELAGRGVGRVHLEVAADNAPALALYRSAGFLPAGRRPGYYRRGPVTPPADGLILSCRLDASPRR